MHALRLCQKYFDNTATTFHESRKKALQVMTCSLLRHGQLTLTSLGRHLPGRAYVKHKIKRVDRFLGNPHVYHELPLIYREMLEPLLASLETLVIAVDWSGCCTPDYHVLRASVVYQGRSIPIYNKVVAEHLQEAPSVQEAFLDELKDTVLPVRARVIVMTDGGFKTPWFDKVLSLGWDYVARVRGRIYCQLADGDWQNIKALQAQAGYSPRYLGEGLLGKTSDTQCSAYFFTVKQRSKGRHKSKLSHPEKERRYAQSHNDPWVIVTSLEGGKKIARNIINLYRKRMQIEQNFRDDKNARWGAAWRYSRTRDVARISVLCLIATMATLLLWLIGFTAEQKQLHRQFQANTVTSKRVLSYLFLAKQILFHCPEHIGRISFRSFIHSFAEYYQQQPELAHLQ